MLAGLGRLLFDDIDEMQMVGRFESCVDQWEAIRERVEEYIYIFLQPAAGSIDRFRRKAAGRAGFFLFFGESRHPPLPTTRRNLRHQTRRGGGEREKESERKYISDPERSRRKKRGELSTRVKEKRAPCCMYV